jgi:hypothetical protein
MASEKKVVISYVLRKQFWVMHRVEFKSPSVRQLCEADHEWHLHEQTGAQTREKREENESLPS